MWTHIKHVDTEVPDYPKQGLQFYVVSLDPNDKEKDPYMDQGFVSTVPGYLLGRYRSFYQHNNQDWYFMTVEAFYLMLGSLVVETVDAADKKLIIELRNQVEDLKARVAYHEAFQARVRKFHQEVQAWADSSNILPA